MTTNKLGKHQLRIAQIINDYGPMTCAKLVEEAALTGQAKTIAEKRIGQLIGKCVLVVINGRITRQ